MARRELLEEESSEQPREYCTGMNKLGWHEIQRSPRIVVRGKLGRAPIHRA
jgi:hypothetical protein